MGLFFKLKENNGGVAGVLNILPLASLIVIVIGYSAGKYYIYVLYNRTPL